MLLVLLNLQYKIELLLICDPKASMFMIRGHKPIGPPIGAPIQDQRVFTMPPLLGRSTLRNSVDVVYNASFGPRLLSPVEANGVQATAGCRSSYGSSYASAALVQRRPQDLMPCVRCANMLALVLVLCQSYCVSFSIRCYTVVDCLQETKVLYIILILDVAASCSCPPGQWRCLHHL